MKTLMANMFPSLGNDFRTYFAFDPPFRLQIRSVFKPTG